MEDGCVKGLAGEGVLPTLPPFGALVEVALCVRKGFTVVCVEDASGEADSVDDTAVVKNGEGTEVLVFDPIAEKGFEGGFGAVSALAALLLPPSASAGAFDTVAAVDASAPFFSDGEGAPAASNTNVHFLPHGQQSERTVVLFVR